MESTETDAAAALIAEECLFDELQTDLEDDRKICLECGHEYEVRDARGHETFAVGHYGCPRCRSWTLVVVDPESRLLNDEAAGDVFAAVAGFRWPGTAE